MSVISPSLTISLDPSNPGQFFACCGFLELADRLWQGAEGWFSSDSFCIQPSTPSTKAAAELISNIAQCPLVTTMSAEEVQKLDELGSRKKKDLSANDEAEKKRLESLRREAPLRLEGQFQLRLDWWLDDRSGGSRFKTWAGQQSVIDIAEAMKKPIEDGGWNALGPDAWLSHAHADGNALPFNFDSDLGPQSAPLDVGFSLDPLGMGTPIRPMIEFAAFVGLQRFRPRTIRGENRHRYTLWRTPLLPSVASAAACGAIPVPDWPTFEFPLLYRTKYLKSFLPAQPYRGDA